MNVRTRKWVRGGLVYLTVSFAAVGLWATLDPRGFYDGFPGAGRQWVAGDGPYNAHLVSDAGIGFLAVGVVLLLAAVWMGGGWSRLRWWPRSCTTSRTCCSTSAIPTSWSDRSTSCSATAASPWGRSSLPCCSWW